MLAALNSWERAQEVENRFHRRNWGLSFLGLCRWLIAASGFPAVLCFLVFKYCLISKQPISDFGFLTAKSRKKGWTPVTKVRECIEPWGGWWMQGMPAGRSWRAPLALSSSLTFILIHHPPGKSDPNLLTACVIIRDGALALLVSSCAVRKLGVLSGVSSLQESAFEIELTHQQFSAIPGEQRVGCFECSQYTSPVIRWKRKNSCWAEFLSEGDRAAELRCLVGAASSCPLRDPLAEIPVLSSGLQFKV